MAAARRAVNHALGLMLRLPVAVLFCCTMPAHAAAVVPSLHDLAGNWVDLTKPVSAHVNASHLDLPIVANFHGSAGSSPNGDWGSSHTGGVSFHGVRPVDLFALNSLEIPPFAGCGNSAAHGTPFGCGRLLVGGQHVDAAATRYQADEVQRRSSPRAAGGLTAASAMRMLFEASGVLWELKFTNPSTAPIVADVLLELPAMVHEYAHVAWVQPLPYDPSNFTYTSLGNGLRGVLSVGKASLTTPSMRPAASLFAFVGEQEPDIQLAEVPRASLQNFTVAPGATRTIKIIMAIGSHATAAQTLAQSAAGSEAAFDRSWAAAHTKWEARWQAAFDPHDEFFTGSVPTLDLEGTSTPGSEAAGVSRVYYASVLSIISQMRTNLPLLYDKVWPTSQGSNEALRQGGVVIGGAISYFWDEALSSMLVALLEPRGRPPTYQAWMTMDMKGKKHNWFDLDCGPIGTVYGACNFTTTTDSSSGSPQPTRGPTGKLAKFYPFLLRNAKTSLLDLCTISRFDCDRPCHCTSYLNVPGKGTYLY